MRIIKTSSAEIVVEKTLLHNLPKIFRNEMGPPFREQLIDLWNGKLFQQREVVNYALDGTKLHLLLQFSVLPTRTLNRSFYVDELNRLERKGPLPVTIIVVDLNGLKATNDEFGHAAGDALLRRAGEVFDSLVKKPASVARIGGDEFAVLLPGTDAVVGETILASLKELVEINNQFYPDVPLSISAGIASSRPGDRLEQVVKRADMKMLHAKRMYYLRANRSRRKTSAAAGAA